MVTESELINKTDYVENGGDSRIIKKQKLMHLN
jgi:hypothetical protein